MAFDIEINSGKEISPHRIKLEYNEFDMIVDLMKKADDFSLLKRCMSDYFDDGEIFLNELNDLKHEVTELGIIVKNTNHFLLQQFVNDFNSLT